MKEWKANVIIETKQLLDIINQVTGFCIIATLTVSYINKDLFTLSFICTGLIIICDIFEERGLPYVWNMWGDPSSCHFPLFNNLPRLDVMHLHMVFLVMLVSAFFIMLGFMYRLACFTYMLTYWYIFFLDKTKWNNHSYLYGLLSVLFFFTNGNYYW